MTGQTLTLHRVFKAEPSRIHRAFLAPLSLLAPLVEASIPG
jgi:hypothetical protein